MIGVIVKKDGIVIEKRVLEGNDEVNLKNCITEQKANPDKEIIVYPESEKANFNLIQVPFVKSPEQIQWDSLKGVATDTEKLFAKKLGLDG